MKIMNEAGAEYFKVDGLPPGTYTVIAGNAAGESSPATFVVTAPPLVIPDAPEVTD